MISSHIHILFVNAAILLVVGIFYDAAIRAKQINLCAKIIHGFFVGFIGIALMSIPWSFTQGVNIDARSVLLSISGLFFGFIPTLIATAITIIYRTLVGGAGMLAGIGIILSASTIGLLFHWYFFKKKRQLSLWSLFFMGLLTHILMLSCVFLLPGIMAENVFRQILLPIITLYPLATVLLGYLLLNHLRRNTMESRLRESEYHYRELFMRAPIPYQSLAEDASILNVNHAWLDTLGYSEEEVIGKNFSEFIHPDCFEVLGKNFPIFKERGRVDGIEFIMRKKNGEYINTSYTGRIVRDEAGKFLHTQCIFDDVTQRSLTETALRESMHSLKQLFDNAPMGIFRTTAKGKVYHINRGFAKIIGFDNVQEAYSYIAAPDTKFFVDENQRNQWIRALRQENLIENFEFEAYRSDGTTAWLLLNASIDDTIGNDDFFIDGFCVDITEQKIASQQLHYSEAIMRGIFDYMSSGSGIYEVKNDGSKGSDYIIRFFNRESLRQERKELKDVIGKSLQDLRPRINEFGLVQVLQKVYQSGQAMYLPSTHYVDENFDSWYDNWVFKLPTGEVVTIYNDVSDTVKYQESLQNSNLQLEKMVQDRTQKLQEINDELKAFTHSVAHDLRAPLRSIEGFAMILAEDHQESLAPEAKRLLHVIHKNVKQMDRLIADLLALSKLSRQDLNIAPTDMHALVQDCFNEISIPHSLDGFEIVLKDLPTIHCDAVLLKHVWMNLIGNAIKYTMPSAKKYIEIGTVQEGKNTIFYIRDSGMGFDEKYSDKLFQLFQRLHSDDQFEGSGVGLAIVHRLITKHDGKVWAKGIPNQGAEFFFSLPTAEGE